MGITQKLAAVQFKPVTRLLRTPYYPNESSSSHAGSADHARAHQAGYNRGR